MGVLRAFVRESELFQQLSTFEAEGLGQRRDGHEGDEVHDDPGHGGDEGH